MVRPLRIAYPGAWYHVTSRGNEQKDVFKSRKDCEVNPQESGLQNPGTDGAQNMNNGDLTRMALVVI